MGIKEFFKTFSRNIPPLQYALSGVAYLALIILFNNYIRNGFNENQKSWSEAWTKIDSKVNEFTLNTFNFYATETAAEAAAEVLEEALKAEAQALNAKGKEAEANAQKALQDAQKALQDAQEAETVKGAEAAEAAAQAAAVKARAATQAAEAIEKALEKLIEEARAKMRVIIAAVAREEKVLITVKLKWALNLQADFMVRVQLLLVKKKASAASELAEKARLLAAKKASAVDIAYPSYTETL